jgi:glyoxylase-like metal-dependent hydrolase (beta-lactamase superfamily II)
MLNPITPIAIGDRRVIPVVDFVGPGLVAARVYPNLPPADLTRLLDAYGDDYADATRTRLWMVAQGFLVLGAGRTILVDTCLGGTKPRRVGAFPGFVSDWLTALARTGVPREVVDTVVTTHLHHDHVGWNTILTPAGDLEPTFPNARYLVVEGEYRYFTGRRARPLFEQHGDYLADSVLPLERAGQLDLVAADYRIDTGIRLIPAPGHTPGHVVVEITSGNQTALLAADLVHHPLQLRHPEISAAMCLDPAASATSRRRILDRYADTGALFFASHLPHCGYISRRDTGYALIPAASVAR